MYAIAAVWKTSVVSPTVSSATSRSGRLLFLILFLTLPSVLCRLRFSVWVPPSVSPDRD